MITIVDYGVGNLGSVSNMLRHIGVKSCVASTPEQLRDAEKLILPGVGAFDAGMQALAPLFDVLNQKVIVEKTPVLGLCLGMQLLMNGSEEGQRPGLGWIPGKCVKFNSHLLFQERPIRIPHMGWNLVKPTLGCRLFEGIEDDPRFYFVHSFHAVCDQPSDVLGMTHYGLEFASAIGRDHIMGVQFHPEKSHKFGMALLRNFARVGHA